MKEFKKGIGAEPEEEPAPKPQPVATAVPNTAESCAYCKGSLEAGWSHCPRCGTPAAKEPHPPK